MIPYGRQSISADDISAVERVLRSDFLTQGPAVPAFEEALARRVGARHAIAQNSATSALHTACMALGLEKGDLLWTSPNTFVASANCALYCGADIDFVDIDPDTFNMSASALEAKLKEAAKLGRLPKIVVPVHFAGQPADMRAIHALSRTYGFRLIEDASHAVGALLEGEAVGNGRYSDITIFSFHPVKILTTAEGGLALTNDAELAERMRLLRSHGITRDTGRMSEASHGPWYYEQIELGWNYRMTDLQAALGLSQLERLDAFLERRQQIAKVYAQGLGGIAALSLPVVREGCQSAFHLYVVRMKGATLETNRAAFEALRAAGIGVNKLYIPVYRQPYYREKFPHLQPCPEAERFYRESIALPMYAALTDSQQKDVIQAVRTVLG